MIEDDLERDRNLARFNLKVLRFSEIEVMKDMFNVLRTLEAYLEEYNN